MECGVSNNHKRAGQSYAPQIPAVSKGMIPINFSDPQWCSVYWQLAMVVRWHSRNLKKKKKKNDGTGELLEKERFFSTPRRNRV